MSSILPRGGSLPHVLARASPTLWRPPQIFSCGRLRFSEIPMKLAGLLQHPDPIVINHVIR